MHCLNKDSGSRALKQSEDAYYVWIKFMVIIIMKVVLIKEFMELIFQDHFRPSD